MCPYFIPDTVNKLIDDFKTFLDFIEFEDMTLTQKNKFLKRKALHQLNQMMSEPNQNVSQYNDQPEYPKLHLFHQIGLAGGLFQKRGQRKNNNKVELFLDERSEKFRQLSFMEKYFFLLETLWREADWNKLQIDTYRDSPVHTVDEVLEIISLSEPDVKIALESASTLRHLLNKWGAFLIYFEFFGFWEIIKKETKAKKNYRAQDLIPTSFGIKLSRVLKSERPLSELNKPHIEKSKYQKGTGADILNIFNYKERKKESKELPTADYQADEIDEEFILPFIPLFPEVKLNETLSQKEDECFEGNIIFKVALNNKVYRKIKLSVDHTLADLHLIIQQAFNFDNDHLYAFFMDGKVWSDNCYNSPRGSYAPYADEKKIGDLELFVGRTFLYLFDYGDMWKFNIRVMDLLKDEIKVSQPKILHKEGSDPRQYQF